MNQRSNNSKQSQATILTIELDFAKLNLGNFAVPSHFVREFEEEFEQQQQAQSSNVSSSHDTDLNSSSNTASSYSNWHYNYNHTHAPSRSLPYFNCDDLRNSRVRFRTGELINGRYTIKSFIGQGTFGTVLLCRDVKARRLSIMSNNNNNHNNNNNNNCNTSFDSDGKKLDTCRNSSFVAMKILRNTANVLDDAEKETDILKKIQSHNSDNDGDNNIVKFLGKFRCVINNQWHVCILFEPLGKSLWQFMKQNDYCGYILDHIREIGKHLFTAINFCHNMGIIHTDLKLENILFESDLSTNIAEYLHFQDCLRKFNIKPQMCDSNTSNANNTNNSNNSNANNGFIDLCGLSYSTWMKYLTKYGMYYCVPLSRKVKVIDFGGAVIKKHNNDTFAHLCGTIEYQSPETILGIEWNEMYDIWSIGCILAELLTGRYLIDIKDSYASDRLRDCNHLRLIQHVLDRKIPTVSYITYVFNFVKDLNKMMVALMFVFVLFCFALCFLFL